MAKSHNFAVNPLARLRSHYMDIIEEPDAEEQRITNPNEAKGRRKSLRERKPPEHQKDYEWSITGSDVSDQGSSVNSIQSDNLAKSSIL